MGLEYFIPLDLPEEKVIPVIIYSWIIAGIIAFFIYFWLIKRYTNKANELKIRQPGSLFLSYFSPLSVFKLALWSGFAMLILKLFFDWIVIGFEAMEYIIFYCLLDSFIVAVATRYWLVRKVNKDEKLTPPIFKYRKVTNWWGKPKY